MPKPISTLLIALFALTLNTGVCQFYELGLSMGSTVYIGDINPGGFFTNAAPGAAAFFRWNWHPHWATRVELMRGNLAANDSKSPKMEFRERNLSFRSNLWEFALWQELNISAFKPARSKTNVFAPYIAVGVAAFRFNPQAKYQGNWVDLQPLGTEGQGLEAYPDRKKYQLYQPAFALGAGLRLALTRRVNVGFDWAYRFLFTDYLDDVSSTYVSPQDLSDNGPLAVALSNRTEEYTGLYIDKTGERRGNSNNKDAYVYWSLRLSFNIYSRKYIHHKKPLYHLNKWL